jgi:hypothetical protein
MRWFSSDAGQVAKIEAPLGYAKVRAHALFHRDFLRKQQGATMPQAPATTTWATPEIGRSNRSMKVKAIPQYCKLDHEPIILMKHAQR